MESSQVGCESCQCSAGVCEFSHAIAECDATTDADWCTALLLWLDADDTNGGGGLYIYISGAQSVVDTNLSISSVVSSSNTALCQCQDVGCLLGAFIHQSLRWLLMTL